MATSGQKSKKNESASESQIDPKLLKWLFLGLLCALFVLGVIVQVQYVSSKPSTDPNAEIKRRLGMMDTDPNAGAAPPTPFGIALRKMADADATIRTEGMNEAMQLDKNAAVPYVAKMMGDGDPNVRAGAAGLVAGSGVGGYTSQIAALLSDPHPLARNAAVDAMSRMAYEPGMIYLLSTPLASTNPEIVSCGLRVWRLHGGKEPLVAANVVAPALSSNDDNVLEQAISTIGITIGPENMTSLVPLLEAVKARKADKPAGTAASVLLDRIKAATGAR